MAAIVTLLFSLFLDDFNINGYTIESGLYTASLFIAITVFWDSTKFSAVFNKKAVHFEFERKGEKGEKYFVKYT